MTTLGNHHHDFPQLAKQSGFFFQSHRGKVNWSEIGNLDLNDITENRNFHLLERNLINVVNCNLEKEYESKILDRNFVKLFKLAQLGVEYLSYCETYLDRCVIILQEQLLSFQEECKSLKNENEKRREESRIKRKNKTQSFQCEKCDKAFISDVYLKFHDKRRHNSPNTPKSFNGSIKSCLDSSQQTEQESKTSTSTQTVLLSDRSTLTQSEEIIEKTKTEHAVKIDNLELEIQHLKERLRRAENALTEKVETSKSNGCHTPMCHNTMLLLLPSQQAPSGSSSYQEVSPKYLVPAPEILQPKCSLMQAPADTKPAEDSSHLNVRLESTSDKNEINLQKNVEINSNKKESNEEKESLNLDAATVEGVQNKLKTFRKEANEDLECDKENLDPNTEKSAKINKPLPPPRKSKKLILTRLDTENPKAEPPAAPARTQSKPEGGNLVSPVMVRSTPVKEGSSGKSSQDIYEEFPENISDIEKRQSTSNDSLKTDQLLSQDRLADDHPRSFFKNIVKKSSPKFQFFRKNLRRSLTTLCDSVSSTGKDSTEGVDPAKSAVVEGLNGQLRELGVDPEWSGIPKKTMRQKLKILKHRRKLLAKENPMYPVIRQNIEQKIFHKLKKNFDGKKTNLRKKLSKESVSADEAPAREPETKIEAGSAKPQKCVMYDIESDSESNSSHSEINLDEFVEEKALEKKPELENKPLEKEFDFSVFQVGRGSFNKAMEKDVSVRVEDWASDSDTDGDLSVGKNVTTLSELPSGKRKDEVPEEEDEERRLGYFFQRQDKPDNQSILKSEGFQSKLELNPKKKVWFRNSSDDIEDGLSDSPTEDWSFKSDWDKGLG